MRGGPPSGMRPSSSSQGSPSGPPGRARSRGTQKRPSGGRHSWTPRTSTPPRYLTGLLSTRHGLFCGPVFAHRGPDLMMADAVSAVCEELVDSPGRPFAIALLAEAHFLSGAVEQARASFTEASATAVQLGCPTDVALAEAELALLAMDRNNWLEAAQHINFAFTVIDEAPIQDYVVSTLAYVEAAGFRCTSVTARKKTVSSLGR